MFGPLLDRYCDSVGDTNTHLELRRLDQEMHELAHEKEELEPTLRSLAVSISDTLADVERLRMEIDSMKREILDLRTTMPEIIPEGINDISLEFAGDNFKPAVLGLGFGQAPDSQIDASIQKFLQQICTFVSGEIVSTQKTAPARPSAVKWTNVPDIGLLPEPLIDACADFLHSNPDFQADLLGRVIPDFLPGKSVRTQIAEILPHGLLNKEISTQQPAFQDVRRLAAPLPPGPVAPSSVAAGPYWSEGIASNSTAASASSSGAIRTQGYHVDSDERQEGASLHKPGMPVSPKAEPLLEDATTLIVRNIPARCTQATLLDLWPPNGVYNLIHLPFDHKRKCHVGKAVINFVSHAAALDFRMKWQGETLVPKAKVKKLSIAVADVQGFREYLENLLPSWRSGRMKNKVDMPVIILPDGGFGDFKALMAFMNGSVGQYGENSWGAMSAPLPVGRLTPSLASAETAEVAADFR